MLRSFGKMTLVVFTALILGGCILYGYTTAERYFIRQLSLQSDASLRLASTGLSGALQKFESIPNLLADRPEIRNLLTDEKTDTNIKAVNLMLKSVAEGVGASDVYVLDSDGLAIAASNFEKPNTFIGNNYKFRPYFNEAMTGEQGRYFALGTSSLKRGFYFSAPIYSGQKITGAMGVKFEVDSFEENWRGLSHDLIVTDDDQIIFMSSNADWLFSSIEPLSQDVLDRLNESRRYPVDQLRTLNAIFVEELETSRLTLPEELGGTEYLVRSQFMPEANWTLHILTDRENASNQAVQVSVLTGLALVLLLLVTGVTLAWRSRQLRRIHEQKEAQILLETRVAERTADLKHEIGERIQAENELRITQKELIQAGKLAALGQMSAALSHELNQPLSAVKTYADNAEAYLERDRPDEAKANLKHISKLTDRMAQISKSLRNFARKPREQIGSVNISNVLKDVEQLMIGRLHEADASLAVCGIPQDVTVIGGHVRLQQVLVNLVNNAIDAMDGQAGARVEVTHADLGDSIEISVRDHGVGIDEEILEHIFDPFFTTKEVNRGLGLGLSISYNILRDFGGNLRAANLSGGGAVFTVTLVKAKVGQGAEL